MTAVVPTTAKGQANIALFQQTAGILGINLTIKQVGTSAEEITNTFDEIANDKDLDGLYVNSRDPSLWQPQFDRIAARNIPIVLGSVTDDPAWTARSVNVLSADRAVINSTNNAADWMVADSNGTASSVVFTIPVQLTLTKIADAFKDRVASTCSGCSTERVDVKGFAAIGKDLPGTVVSYLQSHPDTKYVFMAFADMVTGVPDALRAAGIRDVKVFSQAAGSSNIQYLRDGGQAADVAYTHPFAAYVIMDALSRGMLGASMQAANEWMMPFQLLTGNNINTAATNDDGSVQVAGLNEHFLKLWGKTP
ncbi:sugar ABC transporter substrate-binding protein [Rhodococcus globerulus]|uniref:Substrate-binding domain-containing protein n=1 Tax=Rhodococcus globerulus TaxID=33008 RepID=A0ABU4C4D5_RHOGO|nr:substrate-binding domain-containing protein [Rhodococcus globerulus]MDV6271136.1 substrate-binding domain-containing protein [Rhodococcus globerulus]